MMPVFLHSASKLGPNPSNPLLASLCLSSIKRYRSHHPTQLSSHLLSLPDPHLSTSLGMIVKYPLLAPVSYPMCQHTPLPSALPPNTPRMRQSGKTWRGHSPGLSPLGSHSLTEKTEPKAVGMQGRWRMSSDTGRQWIKAPRTFVVVFGTV